MTTGTPRYPSRQKDLPPPEVEVVGTLRVACDGGGGGLGHPRVWLTIDPADGFVECGYCDKRFVLRGGAADGTAAAVEAGPSGPDGLPADGG